MTIDLERRLSLLDSLGQYLDLNDESWLDAQEKANYANPWFTPGHITFAINNIREQFLDRPKLDEWVGNYTLAAQPKTIGIVMAGNIPLVGFHDFLCGFVSGHYIKMKLSTKDEILMKFLLAKLGEWEPEVLEQISVCDMLKDCDAYIATGSNNTSRYFEQYFARFPHIIRRNRTSVAIIDGAETADELRGLADDVFSYFGLGCRNVTQVVVPEGYDFVPMIDAFNVYEDIINQHKYKNNYDYHLAIYLLNRVHHLTNGSILVVQNDLPFSAVSVLHYKYYTDKAAATTALKADQDIQVLVGHGHVPFGATQKPTLMDYADNVDTISFLCSL